MEDKGWLGDNKGYISAIAIALIFISTVVGVYYVWFRGTPEGYSTISLLDANGKAENYPSTLILNQNNTFTVGVNVENHMEKTLAFEVQVKITQQAIPDFPVDTIPQSTYSITLKNGETWSTNTTTTINATGSYMVVYELWAQDPTTGAMQFTGNACVLNLEVGNQPFQA
jgi:uncharacterized membrane protein